ncbi:hypothetical protein D3C80_256200 [compost metagenome]
MGNDLAAIRIRCQMQLSPTPAGSGAMLLLEPLARAVNRKRCLAGTLTKHLFASWVSVTAYLTKRLLRSAY